MCNSKNIVLIGMPGCGKTTLGRILAERLGYDFADMDYLIEVKFGKIDDLFTQGEDNFRQKETQIAKEVAKENKTVIATGGGIVTRAENMEALSQNGIIVFVDRELSEIILNMNWNNRPLLKDNKDHLEVLYNQRITLYNKYSDIHLKSEPTVDETYKKLLNALKEAL
ncbi:MAG: shikimate kinase [Clostridiales bacterium]|nr:shikimate kinase [Clostridiales bacterium]